MCVIYKNRYIYLITYICCLNIISFITLLLVIMSAFLCFKCSIREVKEVRNQVCPESEVSPVLESSHTANRL